MSFEIDLSFSRDKVYQIAFGIGVCSVCILGAELIYFTYKKWKRGQWFQEFNDCINYKKNEDVIMALLNKISNPKTLFDVNNNSLLHLISEIEKPSIVKYLISIGCDVNHKNKRGNPPLAHAIEYNNYETAKVLLRAGSLYDESNFAIDCNPLHVAVRKGNLKMVKLLLEAGADVNAGERTHIGKNPLQEAVVHWSNQLTNDYHEIVKLLIDSGCNVNNATTRGYDRGQTCLFLKGTIRPNFLKIYRYLLENGASANVTDAYDRSVIQWLLIQPWVYDLGDKSDMRIKEAHALIPHLLQYLKLLIDFGADVNYKIKEDHTDDFVFFVFVGYRCKLAKDQTALGWSLTNLKFESIVDFLLNNGANIDFDEPNVKAALTTNEYEKEVSSMIIKKTALFHARHMEDRVLNFDMAILNGDLQNYYVVCRSELELMKMPVVPNCLSFFNIIYGKVNKRYTENREVVRVLDKKIETKYFFNYNDVLSLRFSSDKRKQNLLSEAEKGLGHILRLNYNEFPTLFNNVLMLMNEQDLEMLRSL